MDEDDKKPRLSFTTRISMAGAELDLEAVQRGMEEMFDTPRKQWLRDPEACRREDLKKRRGHLILNAEVAGVVPYEGMLIKQGGKEYRVIVSQALRGARDKEGRVHLGFWADAPPPLAPLVPLPEVEPVEKDKWFGLMYGLFQSTPSVRTHAVTKDDMTMSEEKKPVGGHTGGPVSVDEATAPKENSCPQCEAGTPVSHNGSPLCRMRKSIASGGTVAHCTCSACF